MDPIYLDYAATTPVRKEVRAAMEPFLADAFGNPSSLHRWGRAARAALERAREEAAAAIGARPPEVYFVRGGTESDNLALTGWCRAVRGAGGRPLLAVSAVEHPAVLETAEAARAAGARVVRIGVSAAGALDQDALRAALDGEAVLVSVMWVNNETGMVLPVAEVVEAAAERGARVHTDAAQAVGKVPVDVREVPVDLLSATGHKVYGPKGTGLLYVREGTPVTPLLHGGGQERGVRPGTEDVAGAVGLAAALRLAVEERDAEARRLAALRDRLALALSRVVPGARINAGEAPRAPHVLSVGVPGLADASSLLAALDLEGVSVSGGSACASGSAKASHVLQALYGPDDVHAPVRFSFGLGTDEAQVDRAAQIMARVVARFRAAA
jgi:cysteine desulfurase